MVSGEVEQVAKCGFLLPRNLIRTCMCVSVCVCLWNLTWETFSCPGPNLRGRFSGPWNICPRNARFCKFQAGPRKWALLLQRVRVLNCACDYTHVGWFVCCETSLGGTFSCHRPNVWGRFFLRGLFLGPRKMYVSFCESSQQYNNLYLCVFVLTTD